MALFNEILQGRYNLILSKLLGMKAGAPAPTLATDLVAGFTLEDDAPEWYALSGGRLCMGQGALAAGGAGNRSQIQLRNAGSSGMIVRLEAILCASTAAVFGFPVRRFNGTLTGTSAVVGLRDTRVQQTPAASVLTQNNAAAQGTTQGVIFPSFGIAGLYSGTWIWPIVLGPATGIMVDPGADNQDLQAVFIWRERAAEPSELQLGA